MEPRGGHVTHELTNEGMAECMDEWMHGWKVDESIDE